jgi:anti-sigma regulatory factor (Ser/Thr protein kinase)
MPFSALQEKDFFGRQDELARLYTLFLRAGDGPVRSAVLFGPRGIGKTELLKQLFGLLFWRQDRVAPFYYATNPALLSTSAFSRSYLVRFICQRLAFEKKEQELLYRDGMSIDSLSILVEDRDAAWARDILDQFSQSAGDPAGELRVALEAPHRSSLHTGRPAVVLIDDFHRLRALQIDGVPDPNLISLFEAPFSYRKAPHLITGNASEIQELSVLINLERIPIQPLGVEPASSKVVSHLRACGVEGDAPSLLLNYLGGNPLYLQCFARAACEKRSPVEQDFWNAYAHEVTAGTLALFWSSVLKGVFPDLGLRKTALSMAYKIYHTGTPLSCKRLAASFALSEERAEAIAHTLYNAGIIRGEFGVFRAMDDEVLRAVIDGLYRKELLTKALGDVEQDLVPSLPPEDNVIRYDMTLPMTKEAELVAAQCLEQLGKNLRLNQDAVGQLQIALIEACINAMEHGKSADKRIYVGFAVDKDRLEASIESAGRDFVVQETGEPFGDREVAKTPGRGWGIKLMKRFADDVRFERTNRGTRIVLVKNLAASAGVHKEETAERE